MRYLLQGLEMKSYEYNCLSHLNDLFERVNFLIHEVMIKNVRKKSKDKKGKEFLIYDIDKNNVYFDELRKSLTFLYHDKGMGYKLLCKEIKILSYTNIRRLIKALDIVTRSGTNCVTDNLKEIRSERAKISSPWKDWSGNDSFKKQNKNSKRYCQGWYLNESKNKLVWLRSSWEYGYAKWLDEQKIDWDVEVRSYLLSTGSYYRPDFFIYENNCLKKIIEIKSTWINGSQNRVDKFYLFVKEYPQICAIIIKDDLFEIINKSQGSVLDEWKKIRKMEKNNDT